MYSMMHRCCDGWHVAQLCPSKYRGVCAALSPTLSGVTQAATLASLSAEADPAAAGSLHALPPFLRSMAVARVRMLFKHPLPSAMREAVRVQAGSAHRKAVPPGVVGDVNALHAGFVHGS